MNAIVLRLSLFAIAAALCGCDVDHPDFLADPAASNPDAQMPEGDSSVPPLPGRIRGGTSASAGGGQLRSADHAAKLVIGSPMPSGRTASADHRAVLGVEILLHPSTH